MNSTIGNCLRTTAGVIAAAALTLLPLRTTAQQARAAQGSGQAAAGNVQNGQRVFTAQKCATCHGMQGAGTTVGRQIGPPRQALAMFIDVVRNPKSPMPSYSTAQISDSELTDLYAYLKSVASGTSFPTTTPAVGAPAGNVENGGLLYVRVGCFECHDRDAEGAATGPRLAPNPLAWTAFSNQVRNPSDAMPAYKAKVLSEKELADIYAFLQSLPKPPELSSIPLLQ